MTIPNPRGESLQQLLPLLQARFPQAAIKKAAIGPEAVLIPGRGFKYVLRKKAPGLQLDHTLPVPMAILSACIAGVIAWYGLGWVQGLMMMSGLIPMLILCAGIGAAVGGLLLAAKAIFRAARKAEFIATEQQIVQAIAQYDFEKNTAQQQSAHA